ncbi:T9SS type A sorting domain-containing protein, partial [Polaribacter reichenbachii]
AQESINQPFSSFGDWSVSNNGSGTSTIVDNHLNVVMGLSGSKYRADLKFLAGTNYTINKTSDKILALKFIGDKPNSGNIKGEIHDATNNLWINNGGVAYTISGPVKTAAGNNIYYFDFSGDANYSTGDIEVDKINIKIADVDDPTTYVIDWVASFESLADLQAYKNTSDDLTNDADEPSTDKADFVNTFFELDNGWSVSDNGAGSHSITDNRHIDVNMGLSGTKYRADLKFDAGGDAKKFYTFNPAEEKYIAVKFIGDKPDATFKMEFHDANGGWFNRGGSKYSNNALGSNTEQGNNIYYFILDQDSGYTGTSNFSIDRINFVIADNVSITAYKIDWVATFTNLADITSEKDIADDLGVDDTDEDVIIDSGESLTLTTDIVNSIVVNGTGTLTVNTTDLDIPRLTINNTGTVTIEEDKALEIESSLTNNSTNSLLIKNGGSLIVKGTSTGNISYQVNANDTNWHLLSSPVVGATYNGTWITDNDIDDTSSAGTNIGIGWYTNTVDANGVWTYATDASNSGSFTNAKGFSIKKDATTNSYVTFTGTLKTDNLTSSITQNTNNWNLLGNPYPSYILVSDLINDNAANLTDTHESVYVWNGTDYVALTSTDYIHPGQGFFVSADNSTADNFSIDASKLSVQTGVTLYKAASQPTITLLMNDGTNVKSTEINYIEDKTKGLDPGFDIGTFTGEPSTFSIYSHLVNENKGIDFMRQSLPNTDFENMIVPIGINASTGKELSFTADVVNLPNDIKVYLEDRVKNTFTLINNRSNQYKVSLDTDLNGVGRFFLHTTQNALNLNSENLSNNINIYTTDNSELKIVGLKNGKTSIKLYNVLGKQLIKSSFNAKGLETISLPKVAKGIYIVQLEFESGKLNKKIILE